MHTFTLKQLRVVNAIIECGSGAAAAERLHVTPASVSYTLNQVRRLSRNALFERRQEGLKPLEAALALQKKYRELLSLAAVKREITVSTWPLIELMLARRLYHRPTANIQTRLNFLLESDTPQERLNKLRSRLVDIDIGGKLPQDKSIVSSVWMRSDMCAIVRQEHPFTDPQLDFEAWHRYTHLCWSRDCRDIIRPVAVSAPTGTAPGLEGEVNSDTAAYFTQAMAARRISHESINLLTLAWLCATSDSIMLIPVACIPSLIDFYPVRTLALPVGLEMRFECYSHRHRCVETDVRELISFTPEE